MNVTPQQLIQIIGQKQVEIEFLLARIRELEAMLPKPEPQQEEKKTK